MRLSRKNACTEGKKIKELNVAATCVVTLLTEELSTTVCPKVT